jgi:hypothetical protein
MGAGTMASLFPCDEMIEDDEAKDDVRINFCEEVEKLWMKDEDEKTDEELLLA